MDTAFNAKDGPKMFNKWISCFVVKLFAGASDIIALTTGLIAQVLPQLPEGDNAAQRYVLYGVAAYLVARALHLLAKAIKEVFKDGDE